jgi:hypothetical protein
MSAKGTKKQKPEDIVLRLIRVAEILIQGQDELIEPAPHPEYRHDQSPQSNDGGKSLQKTQT